MKPFPSNPQIVTPTYRGPDRRGLYEDITEPSGHVEFDDKGNTIWRLRAIPLRRKDDDTANLLGVLRVDFLAVEEAEKLSKSGGYDPYSRDV
jgi:hypothetical protein